MAPYFVPTGESNHILLIGLLQRLSTLRDSLLDSIHGSIPQRREQSERLCEILTYTDRYLLQSSEDGVSHELTVFRDGVEKLFNDGDAPYGLVKDPEWRLFSLCGNSPPVFPPELSQLVFSVKADIIVGLTFDGWFVDFNPGNPYAFYKLKDSYVEKSQD